MKKLAYIWIAIILFASTPSICFGADRSDKLQPTWIKNTPDQLNETYYFKVVETDAGSDLTSARMHSQKELIRSVEREFNITVSDKLESQSETIYNGDDVEYSGRDIYSLNIESTDEAVKIYYEKVDEYYEFNKVGGRSVFKLYTLFAVAKPNAAKVRFDNFIRTEKYGLSAMSRSLIPGWGQFYKGSKVKGSLILGGVAATAIGAMFANNQLEDYKSKINQTHNIDHIRTYQTKVDNFTTTRNVCIGAAATIYVYNLVDAVASAGARRVIVQKRENSPSYSLTPALMDNGSVGMMASVRF